VASGVHLHAQMLPNHLSDERGTAAGFTAARDLDHLRAYLLKQEFVLRAAIAKERVRTKELEAAQRQLRAFALDFRSVRRNERERMREVAEAQEDTAVRLLKASRFRDEETGAHIWRVGLYTRAIAHELKFSDAHSEVLFRASQLHDVGKIGVPDAILRKPGKLNDAEWALMREHTRIGAQVLDGSHSPLLESACIIAATHHEHFDGSGYPNHLQGSQIPLEGRMVKLADTYDALRMQRPYKPLFDHATAVSIILEGDERSRPEHFDPDLLRLFARMHGEFEEIFRQCGDEPQFES